MLNEILLAAILPIVSAPLGWAFKRQFDTNARVTQHDKELALIRQGFDDLKELINTRFDLTDNRLERVERKVLNGDYYR